MHGARQGKADLRNRCTEPPEVSSEANTSVSALCRSLNIIIKLVSILKKHLLNEQTAGKELTSKRFSVDTK
jgi:hypothetical protein